MILQGVRIGDEAVVGANSVVTKDVEPHTVVGGRLNLLRSGLKQLTKIIPLTLNNMNNSN